MRICVLGAGFNSSGLTDGVARAPGALRKAGLVGAVGVHHEVRDLGDVAFSPPVPERGAQSMLLAEDALASMVGAVREEVEGILGEGGFPLLVGGDCPVFLGALAACRASYGDVGLVFVDGHEDAWPPAASHTGEAADSELGLALGAVAAELPPDLTALVRPEGSALLRAEATAVLGPRDGAELAAEGVDSLRGSVWFATDREVGGRAAAAVAEAVGVVRASAPQWWLHVDLDVLATDELAAVDYPQPGGLGWDELTELTVRALGEPGCAGWSVAIYNPDLDVDGAEAARIVRYVGEALETLEALEAQRSLT